MSEEPIAPRKRRSARFCANHPELRARRTCPRCGSFACPDCWDERDALCLTCVAAGAGSFPIAWEQPTWSGLRTTVRDAVVEPGFFERLGRGGLVRALELAIVCWAPSFALVQLFAVTTGPDALRSSNPWMTTCCVAPLGTALVTCALVSAFATWVYVAQRLVGGVASLGDTMRATAFAQVYVLVATPLLLTLWLNLGAAQLLVSSATFLLVAGAQARAVGYFLRGRGRLSATTAFFVSFSPLAAIVLVGLVWVG